MTCDPTIGVIGELLSERLRQIDIEGYRPWDDDAHDRGELGLAAAARAIEAAAQLMPQPSHDLWQAAFRIWPFGDFGAQRRKDPRRCLIIAGALIIAEIERLDRAAQR